MGPAGMIQENLDIKILILFILSRLSDEVGTDVLEELCRESGGVGYFDFMACLSELADTGHVVMSETGCYITELGRSNAETVESSIPFSVRREAAELLKPIETRMRRNALISASHETDDLGCMVKLSLSDGQGEIINLSLLCANEEQAEKMETNFRNNAENIYKEISRLLNAD